MKRLPQFSLRTLLLVTAIVGVLCGCGVARRATMRRYNAAHKRIVELVNETFVEDDLMLSNGHTGSIYAATLFSRGHLEWWVIDDETSIDHEKFCFRIECREGSFLYARPVVILTPIDANSSQQFDAELN